MLVKGTASSRVCSRFAECMNFCVCVGLFVCSVLMKFPLGDAALVDSLSQSLDKVMIASSLARSFSLPLAPFPIRTTLRYTPLHFTTPLHCTLHTKQRYITLHYAIYLSGPFVLTPPRAPHYTTLHSPSLHYTTTLHSTH